MEEPTSDSEHRDDVSRRAYMRDYMRRYRARKVDAPSPERQVWKAMKERCLYPKHKSYPFYGGRGIRVCEEWVNSFDQFIADMGPRPSLGHSIDRIDNNGHYEPGNCRWADRRTQMGNRSTALKITFGGRTMCRAAWARELGIHSYTLKHRLKRWPLEKALTTKSAT